MVTQIEDVNYEVPPLWVRMLETSVLTLLVPVAGLLFNPQDPLFYGGAFAWLIVAPLLAGLRYGFVFGFAAGLLTVAIMVVAPNIGWAKDALSIPYAIGVLLTGMVSGEFTDIWRRRIAQMRIINAYQSTRLNEFVRNFHVLRVSHDQLAERLAANPHNLRDTLLALAERFDVVEPGDDILTERAADILSFIAHEGRVEQCALYVVDDRQRVAREPAAFIGGAPRDARVGQHPMVQACFEHRSMISLKSEMEQAFGDGSHALLAVVPLIDVNDHIWAVVTVGEMPFVDFERGNLHLLSVIGGNLGDVITEAYQRTPADAELARFQFEQRLKRWSQYAARYKLGSLLVAYEIPGNIDGVSNEALTDTVYEQLRALDFGWTTQIGEYTRLIYVLMPLTPERGSTAYRERMSMLLNERFGVDVADSGLVFHQRNVDGKQSAANLIAGIRRQVEQRVAA